MGAIGDFIFEIDYPNDSGVLFSNVNVVNGWCFRASEQISAIELHVNGALVSRTETLTPRLDVASSYPGFGDASFLSGFRCEFDYSELPLGENLFEIHVQTDGARETITRRAFKQGSSAPLKIDDVFVELVGSCNLRCAMCPQGDREWRSAGDRMGTMSVELFERVIEALLREGSIDDYINLYNWGEPLLHPKLGQILDICRAGELKPILSTNLSVPEVWLEPLGNHNVELLLVSISGFSKETHEKNHLGGDFDLVRRNLMSLADHHDVVGEVVIKYLLFDYNAHEIESARSFAEDHGFGFGVYAGALHCAESYFRLLEDERYRQVVERYVDVESLELRPLRYCPQETTITIDHRGELERCCVSWQQGLGVSLFDSDIRDHLEHKTHNAFCARCLASGYSYYTHYGVMSPEVMNYNR